MSSWQKNAFRHNLISRPDQERIVIISLTDPAVLNNPSPEQLINKDGGNADDE